MQLEEKTLKKKKIYHRTKLSEKEEVRKHIIERVICDRLNNMVLFQDG